MGHLTGQELRDSLSAAEAQIQVKKLYYHYKHPEDHYRVEGVAIIEATDQPGVKYVALYEALRDIEFVRPLEEFVGNATNEDGSEIIVDGQPIKRFQLVPGQE